MNKRPSNLKKGDKVAIVSLSSGVLGESFVKHELDLGIKRLEEYGLKPILMPNAMKGIEYIKEHPEARAKDLIEAFKDESIKGIISAIGGEDTFKIIPYIMDNEEYKNIIKNNPKIFTGFSDTTINHLMLNRIGLSTFYGPCLLVDLAELDKEMLPYTKNTFEKFFLNEKSYEIKPSEEWYSDRKSYGIEELGVPRIAHKEERGYEVLNGNGIIEGKLYGGCIESLYDAMTGSRYKEEKDIIEKYNILPTNEEWKEKVLFIETSEEKIKPEELEKVLLLFKEKEVLNNVKGILVGKPIDEVYYNEYKEVYKRVFKDINTPIMYNINFGHSTPRCLLPYDAKVKVDYDNKRILIEEQVLLNRD